jgi:outer membrane protein OmpA-like peptidoglycan-associated protein
MIPPWKILSCVIWFSFQEIPVPVEKLNTQINSRFDEINPVLSDDGQTLYFTRVGHPCFDKTLVKDGQDIASYLDFDSYVQTLNEIYTEIGEDPEIHPFKSSFNQDIWIAESVVDPFDKIYHPSYPLNNALPNSVCATMQDPNTIAILNQFYKDGSMYKGFSYSTKQNGEWQFPQPFHIYDYYNLDSDASLTLNHNGEILLLSLNRVDSRGDHDLYVSFRIHETLWSTPQSLGKSINTPHREVAPFLSQDNRLLLFSSNRPNTSGGNDLYMTFRLDDTWLNWTEPVPLPASINSEADEGQPFFSESTGHLYFISNRDGSSDIFRANFDYSKNLRNDKQALTYVIVKPHSSKSVAANLAQYDDIYEAEVAQNLEKNALLVSVNHNKQIIFKQFKDGLVGNEISLKSIYFKRSKADILPTSFPTLDYLVEMMNAFSNVHIQIRGHTDNVGNKRDLFILSEKRASAVRRYLIRQGIQSFRITARGFGDEIPVTDNSTEEKRALNRRVEVEITKV